LVDTSALIALLDRADPMHGQVRAAFEELAGAELITHGFVVAETVAVVRRRFGVEGVVVLIDDLLPACDILAFPPDLASSALASYRESLPSGTSYVDQVSLGLMQQEGIREALALDLDLAANGVRLLPG